MIYAFVDTNIWIRVLSQGRPGCEQKHFDELAIQVERGDLILLLPEVVTLEYEKTWRGFEDQIRGNLDQLELKTKELFKPKLWTEIEDIQNAFSPFFGDYREKKIKLANDHDEKLRKLFRLPKIVNLKFTPDHYFLAKKRIMAGAMPVSENQAHSDACIIEILLGYFGRSKDKEAQFYFCSENERDFGLKTDRGIILHPILRGGFPPTQFFLNLQDMMAFFQRKERIQEPAKDEVAQALETRRQQESLEGMYYMGLCAKEGCKNPIWIMSPFCERHFWEYIKAAEKENRDQIFSKIEHVLKTLTYREREIVKLRFGLGDGYIYTRAEVGRIFKRSVSTVGRIERRAMRKLLHPIRYRQLRQLFD